MAIVDNPSIILIPDRVHPRQIPLAGIVAGRERPDLLCRQSGERRRLGDGS
jgi:hypothetical protein